VLLEALPYIQDFRGATFVVKYGGSFMDDPDAAVRNRVAYDIAFLAAVGVNVVVVHGGGKAITKAMETSGLKAEFVNGMRVTDEATIAIVKKTLDEVVNRVPVISPVAEGLDGKPYNVNADLVAGRVASALRARRLVYMSDVPGLLSAPPDPESLISTLKTNQVDDLKKRGIIDKGMRPKVLSAVRALQEGVQRVHFVDGRLPHSLLMEIFTDRGIGTEIVDG